MGTSTHKSAAFMFRKDWTRLLAPVVSSVMLWCWRYLGSPWGVLAVYAVLVSAVPLAVTMIDWENARGRTTCYSEVGGVTLGFSVPVGVAYGLVHWFASAHAADLILWSFVGLTAVLVLIADARPQAATKKSP